MFGIVSCCERQQLQIYRIRTSLQCTAPHECLFVDRCRNNTKTMTTVATDDDMLSDSDLLFLLTQQLASG